MLSIAAELARHEPFYQNMAIKYFEHFLYIAHAMTNIDGAGIDLWDDRGRILLRRDPFARWARTFPLKFHSMVGLVPLFAVLAAPSPKSDKRTSLCSRAGEVVLSQHRPDLLQNVAPVRDAGQERHAT